MRLRKAKLPVPAAPSLAGKKDLISAALGWALQCRLSAGKGPAVLWDLLDSAGGTGQAVRGGPGSFPGFPKVFPGFSPLAGEGSWERARLSH